MIAPQPIGFLNTGMPLLVLSALALSLPWLLCPGGTRSHLQVAIAVWAAAGLVLLIGAGVFAVIYSAQGAEVGAAFGQTPLAISGFFVRLSGFAALIWGPLLALAWFGLAQRVEKRKGEDMAGVDRLP